MKTIAIALQKGGTGKTVLSVSLAAALARKHPGQVLLVDCDPQGNSTEWTCAERLEAELANVLLEKCALKDAAEFQFYVFPVDQVFRRAETGHASVFDIGSAKKETLDELERLAAEVGEG